MYNRYCGLGRNCLKEKTNCNREKEAWVKGERDVCIQDSRGRYIGSFCSFKRMFCADIVQTNNHAAVLCSE